MIGLGFLLLKSTDVSGTGTLDEPLRTSTREAMATLQGDTSSPKWFFLAHCFVMKIVCEKLLSATLTLEKQNFSKYSALKINDVDRHIPTCEDTVILRKAFTNNFDNYDRFFLLRTLARENQQNSALV